MLQSYYKELTSTGTLLELSEVRQFLKCDNTDDDTIIQVLIDTVIPIGENISMKDFYSKTYELYVSGLNATTSNPYYFIDVRRSPIISISAMKVYIDGAYTDITDTIIQQESVTGMRLYFSTVEQVPDYDTAYPYRIDFAAGYGATDLPANIKLALMQHVMYLWRNRGDAPSEDGLTMPREALAIYKQYRVPIL